MNIPKTLGILCASALYVGVPLAHANSSDINPSTTTSQTTDTQTTTHHHHKSKTNGNNSNQNGTANGGSNIDSAGMTENRPTRSQ